VFVKVDGKALDAFTGRFRLGSGAIIRIIREEDHLMMLPERRGGLKLRPESESKASCPSFRFEVTLIKDDNAKVTGLTVSCPDPDYTGSAWKLNSEQHGSDESRRECADQVQTTQGLESVGLSPASAVQALPTVAPG
jgi:hypothetical protein